MPHSRREFLAASAALVAGAGLPRVEAASVPGVGVGGRIVPMVRVIVGGVIQYDGPLAHWPRKIFAENQSWQVESYGAEVPLGCYGAVTPPALSPPEPEAKQPP